MSTRPTIVFAADLPECEDCGEPWCPLHELHYADCACIGPNSEEAEEIERGNNITE